MSSGAGRTLDWLDALKGIAILAVVLDHAFILDNYLLWKHLYFSVSWFIFLAGVSNTYSARRHDFQPRRDTFSLWRRRLGSLTAPYLSASVIGYLILNYHHLSVTTFIHQLALFHNLPPLYFLALLLQLLVLFPILYTALYLTGWAGRMLVAVAIVPVAAWLSQLVTFPWVLGAHYLFGASFLYLFVLGMLAEPYLSTHRVHPAFWLLGGAPLFLWAERLNVITNGTLMTHPPSTMLAFYSVGSLAICYVICSRFPAFSLVRAVAHLGRYSLDIFLFHYIFLLPIFPFRHHLWTQRLPLQLGQLMLMAVAVPAAIGGSLLMAFVMRATMQRLRLFIGSVRPRIAEKQFYPPERRRSPRGDALATDNAELQRGVRR